MNHISITRGRGLAMPLLLWAALGAACSGADGMQEGEFDDIESTALAATISQMQSSMDQLYDMNNVLTVSIVMDPNYWESLKTEQPMGGGCGGGQDPWDYPSEAPPRFQWWPTTSVQISGSSFPTGTNVLTGVEIKKKSFCGSFQGSSAGKPALKLKFGSAADNTIGTRHLTLNNSIQDDSYIRQCLGYKLFQQAGLPHSRCNFVHVLVNGQRIQNGIYVNVEPIRERYIDNPANGFVNKTTNGTNLRGNLYEFEHRDDFKSDRLPFIDVEDNSRSNTKMDIQAAANWLAAGNSMTNVVDINQFIKMWAMEFLLKHWDGFTDNTNNTYFYNDVPDATGNPNPAAGNTKFKMIPWGLDQILKPGTFQIDDDTIIGKYIRDNPAATQWRAQLSSQIKTYTSGVFGRFILSGIIYPFVDLMQNKLMAMGTQTGMPQAQKDIIVAEIAEVREQLRLSRSLGLFYAGMDYNSSVYVRDFVNGDMMTTSATENVGPPGSNTFELIRQPFQEISAGRWTLEQGTLGPYRLRNVANNTRRLHSSSSIRSSLNHLLNYTTTAIEGTGHQDYNIIRDEPEPWMFTGGGRIMSQKTGLLLHFGTDDLTRSGVPRVYQMPDPWAHENLVKVY